ncbi:MAG TPA: glycosyltransferase family 39 protein [Candidatus Polarisedimenticolaceae bacterium]
MTQAPSRAEQLAAWASLAVLAAFYVKTLGVPSFWLDEAWEANYYAGYEPEPWYNRPMALMAAQRAIATIAGPSELALRALPCLAALAAVALLWRLARRRLGATEAWIGAAALALAPPFVLLAHQLKHYPFDALATVALWTALDAWRQRRSAWSAAAFAATGCVAFGFSFTAPFAIAGCAVAALAASRADRRGLGTFATACAATAAVFAAVYLAFHAADASNPNTVDWFEGAYPPSGGIVAWVRWALAQTVEIAKLHTGAPSGLALAAVAGAGLLAARADGRWIFVAAGGALAAALAAGTLRMYPYGAARTTLWIAPAIALTVGCAFGTFVGDGRARAARALVAAAFAYLAFYPALRDLGPYLSTGWKKEHLRPFVETIARERRAGEAIYVYEDALSAFRFYWRRLGREGVDPDLAIAPRSRLDLARHRVAVDALAERYDRVWGVYTHVSREEMDAIRAALAARYERVRGGEDGDARWDLWVRRAGAAP